MNQGKIFMSCNELHIETNFIVNRTKQKKQLKQISTDNVMSLFIKFAILKYLNLISTVYSLTYINKKLC